MRLCTHRNESGALIHHSDKLVPVQEAAQVGYVNSFEEPWHTANERTAIEQTEE